METKPGNLKFDLQPWLLANSTKISVIFRHQGTGIDLHDQIATLFGHFIPNLHAIVLVDPDMDLISPRAYSMRWRYGNRLHLVQRDLGGSVKAARLEAISYALDKGSTHIIQLSQKVKAQANYLPKMLRYIDRYDLINGSRFLSQQEFHNPQIQAQYRLDRWINGFALNKMLGGIFTDANSGVRCWSRLALERLLPRLQLRDPRLMNLEMAFLSYKFDVKMIEIPIDYQPSVNLTGAIHYPLTQHD